ncbi:putative nucleotidyltransferase, Ribonuclease H [Helianthus anomalus]
MIREVKYPRWLANVVVVQKKNGKWRICVDFTDLNKACSKDPFPLPHIDSMVDATAGHELLTFIDASSGFQQIQMEPSDQEDTVFMTPTGIYCYIAMPFGLRNAGATYQRLVNMMFKDQIGQTMEVYIDDMVVKSRKTEDHLKDLEEAFNILDKYNMELNPSKCHFGVKAGKFLGYMVTKRGIEASPEQIKAIVNIKSHANAKDVQRLTGRIAAFNRFISKSSEKCKEFYDILRKNKKFEWTEKHESALKALKDYLSSAPTLMKPEKGDVLSLYLAVSLKAVSAVLVKDHEGTQHPVYYVTKSLLDVESRYSHLEKLILALIMASTKLRHYFETHVIIVKTNFPIKNVLKKPEMSGRMAK